MWRNSFNFHFILKGKINSLIMIVLKPFALNIFPLYEKNGYRLLQLYLYRLIILTESGISAALRH